MELIHTHGTPGPGRIKVMTPGLPVRITVNRNAEERSVHVRSDGAETMHAGPGGPGGRTLNVIVGAQGLINSLADFFGLREGSTISGGGSTVTSSGRGSIVSGGSISHAVTGRNARVVINGKSVEPKPTGVHLVVPPGCIFDIRKHDGVTVHYDGAEMTIEAAAQIGILECARWQ